jgi:glycosyltransferase involved in cell wall biosynthesis
MSAARKVLVLAYFFPPVGGGTSYRNAGLVRHFPDFGYDPRIVTGAREVEHYWTPTDESVGGRLPEGTPVERLPGPEPESSAGWRRRAERLLDLDGSWYRWWLRGSYEVARRHAGEADLIYAPLEPYETSAVASRLADEFSVPWVADLLDPWAVDEMRLHVSGLHRRRDLRRMRRHLANASAIVMSTEEARRRVAAELPSLAPALVEPIAVGFDRDDFRLPAPRRDDGKFRIVHTGFLHTEAGLRHRKTARLRRLAGGEYLPVDFLTRSHVFLLEAVDRLLAEEPELSDVLEVQLAGAPTDADRRVAARSSVTRLLGFLPHDETMTLIRTADLLFVPMQDVAPPNRAGLTPQKIYEYLAAGVPILAAVPEGDARTVLGEAGNAHVCAPADVDGMVRALRTELDRWRAGSEPPRPRAEVVARYERREIARRLAAVFDDVLGRAEPKF